MQMRLAVFEGAIGRRGPVLRPMVIATLTYRRDYTENPNAMTTPAA